MAGLRPGYLMAMYNLVRRAAEPRLATVDDLYILGRLESVSERLHDLARERKQIMDALREFQNMIEYIDRVREGRRGR
jgi:chromosome segregation ATPase